MECKAQFGRKKLQIRFLTGDPKLEFSFFATGCKKIDEMICL